jgi:hypoxanthine-DNA glycosylase
MHKEEIQVHPFPPIYDKDSRILILGTMPSVASRQNQFYYGHPQNRFWKVLSVVLGSRLPENIQEKKELLLNHGVALWDVLASCRIQMSKDSSIKDPVVNDFGSMLKNTRICAIYTNGRKADSLYQKLVYPYTGILSTVLPSTSPANAQYDLEKLIGEWMVIREYLHLF